MKRGKNENAGNKGAVRLHAEGLVAGTGAVTATLGFETRETWHSAAVNLSSLQGGSSRIRLHFDLPDGGRLLLRDFHLEHKVPVPALRRPRPPQVLLISVDTLREDAIAALGGEAETPHLDRLVAAAEVWTPHYAAASWTKPSHGSLLTGQYPWFHGANSIQSGMYPEVTTVAERFRGGGFLTFGLVYDCAWLDPKFGFARGFDEYRAVRWRLPRMVRQVANWMARHRNDRFFAFLHTFDVHSDFSALPYEAPGVTRATVAREFGVHGYGCREGVCASQLLKKLNANTVDPLPAEDEVLRFLYTRGVEATDSELGLLFDALRELGIFDNMLIVVTSDHGEAFFEHGRVSHGDPWNEVLKVPLIVKWPNGERAGERRHLPSSGVDVAPTLLEAYGLDRTGLAGVDLVQARTERPLYSLSVGRVVFSGEMKGVFKGPALNPVNLFDLAGDPGELRDLVTQAHSASGELRDLLMQRLEADRRALATIRGAHEAGSQGGLSAEDSERLKALGYLE